MHGWTGRRLSRLVAILSDTAAFRSSKELLGLLRSEAPRVHPTVSPGLAAGQSASHIFQHPRCLSTSTHSYSEPRAATSHHASNSDPHNHSHLQHAALRHIPIAQLPPEYKAHASTSEPPDQSHLQHAALRHIPIAQLPPEYKAALHSCIASSGANAREVRIMVNQLRSKAADLEKHLLSITPPPVRTNEGQQSGVPRTASGRVTKQALHEASIALEHEGAHAMDPEVFNRLLGLPSPSSTTNRGKVKQGQRKSVRGARPKPPIEYNEQQAVAAAAASSSAWFATSLRVLHELKSADPSFEPTSMLDYGAGFGGALQAAQLVWPSQVCNVTAVERSPAMLHQGVRHSRPPPRAATNIANNSQPSSSRLPTQSAPGSSTSPRVTWVRGLPKLPGKDAASVVQPKYNLVVGAYVLSEETLPQERLQLIDQLWGHTSDTLVLVEHGTRLGSSIILEARSRILDREARKAARHLQHQQQQQQQNHHQQQHDAPVGKGEVSEERGGLDQHGSARFWPPGAVAATALPVGAHVVAPCPHDGRCPLEGNPRSWCHFEQRYEAPDFMRNTIGRGKDGIAVRSAMDAHFCYVILRRGPRPSGPPSHVTVQSLQSAYARQAPEPSFTDEEIRQEILHERLSTHSSAGPLAAPGEPTYAASRASEGHLDGSLNPVRQRQPLFGTQDVQVEDGEGPLRVAEAVQRFHREGAHELEGREGDVSNTSNASASVKLSDEELRGSGSNGEVEVEEHGLSQMEAFEQRYPAHARGLVDRLMALEDAGLSWANNQEGGLNREAAATAMSLPLDADAEEGEEGEFLEEDPELSTDGEEAEDSNAEDVRLSADGHMLPNSAEQQRQRHHTLSDASSGQGVREDEEGWDEAEEDEEGEHEQGELEQHSALSGMAAQNSQGRPFADADPALSGMGAQDLPGRTLTDADPAEVERAVQRLRQRHSAEGGTVHGLTYGGAGMPWPRIYRKPLKRGGHVVLDLCVPAGPGGDGGDVASQGKLERQGLCVPAGPGGETGGSRGGVASWGRLKRQVISRAKASRLPDRNAYKLAREVSWGDLWPAAYLAKSKDTEA